MPWWAGSPRLRAGSRTYPDGLHGVTTVAIVGAALVQQFWVAVPLYLVSTAAFGVYMPVKQGWLNARIPSEERATIISLDALFGDGGMTVGQVGLGYLSQVVSIPAAWLVGGAVQAVGVPLLGAARRAERAEPAGAAPGGEEPCLGVESPGCLGPEPAIPGGGGGAVAAGGDERVA